MKRFTRYSLNTCEHRMHKLRWISNQVSNDISLCLSFLNPVCFYVRFECCCFADSSAFRNHCPHSVMSADTEKRVWTDRTADSAPTHTTPAVSVPGIENKDDEKSNPSLHAPVDGQAGSELNDDAQQSRQVPPATPVAGDGKPLETAVSKEVLERSRFRTALIMFSLCVRIIELGISKADDVRCAYSLQRWTR
jgi:hypothetical protein